jgi:predicted Zn-dependent protease
LAVFDVLVGVGRTEAGGRMPSWLSTHPEPELRRQRVQAMVTGAPPEPEPDPDYLAGLDGVIYGEDPRDGLLVEATFAHPRMGFAIDLPAGWKATHDGPQVMAISPDEAALFLLAPTDAESAAAALEAFFADGSITRGEQWNGEVGGFPVASAGFSSSTSNADLSGLIAFVDYDESTVLALAALGPSAKWAERLEAVAVCFASLRRAPRALREVEPMRVRILELPSATTLLGLQDQRPSAIDVPHLALLNGIDDPTATLPAGTLVKRVEGGPPTTSAAGSTAPSRPPAARTPG